MLTPSQQADIDRKRGTFIVPSRTSINAPWFTQSDWNSSVDRDVNHYEKLNASKASHNRLVNIGKIASIAIPTAGVGLSLAGPGAVASVPGAVGSSSAPLGVGTVAGGAAKGMTLGNLWNFANLGVGAVSSLFGQRSQNRALNQQTALAEREMSMRLAADAEARAEAKRQFDAQQANVARQMAADDEERAYSRSERDYARRLSDEREARMAPYRAQAERARMRLAQFLGL